MSPYVVTVLGVFVAIAAAGGVIGAPRARAILAAVLQNYKPVTADCGSRSLTNGCRSGAPTTVGATVRSIGSRRGMWRGLVDDGG